jgi:hypothetical protein
MNPLPFPAPGPILTNNAPQDNAQRPGGDGEWTKNLVDGKLFLRGPSPRHAWVSVHDPDNEFDQPLTGIGGTVVNNPHISKEDLWFTHPFGNDFEFHVAPDKEYFDLVAPNMQGSYLTSTTRARTEFDLDVPGVIGMEMDSGLVPEQYRPQFGDRVCLWGRLIVDAGHDDFHTEIHPPLLMASARPTRSRQQGETGVPDATTVQFTTRPFIVSQEFSKGGLFKHIITQLGESALNPLPTGHIDAHPKLMPKPFAGLNIFAFNIRPPTARRDVRDVLVFESTVTQRSDSVAISAFHPPGEDAVRIIFVLNDAGYVPPPEPKKHDRTIEVTDVFGNPAEVIAAYAGLFTVAQAGLPQVALVIAKGFPTHTYESPSGLSPNHDDSFSRRRLEDAGGNIPINRDDKQVFPLQGTLKLEWERAVAPFPDDTTKK